MKKTIFLTLASLLATIPALAEGSEEMVAAATGSSNSGLIALSAAIAIGVAALGGALGQGKIGASAMDGIARNPQAQKNMFVPMILSLVLIESLVIYALVIAFQLAGKA